jgi:Fe-S cluster assembly scaffold protein SufB
MIKKIPKSLINKIERFDFLVSNKATYKKISAGKKESISLNENGVNNNIVHVGSGAQFNLSGLVGDTVFILEKKAAVNWLIKEKSKVKYARKIFAIVSSDAKFNLILSEQNEVESGLKINFVLVGANAAVNIEEAIRAKNFAEISRDITIDHLAFHTESNYFARAIADDNAKVAIKIKTLIAKKASKSVARQRIDNLILSDKATVKGWPQLEINNDDVICNHALTTGHLNEDEVFYTESRGINKQKALAMIADGFLKPIEDKFSNSITKIYG